MLQREKQHSFIDIHNRYLNIFFLFLNILSLDCELISICNSC